MRGLVDYVLARRSVLRDLHRGRLSRRDVCDAHPDLVRAARMVGDDSGCECPVCELDTLRIVSYAFGDSLKSPAGRLWVGSEELGRLERTHDELKCYEVEVCATCGWNHLRRSYLIGRRVAG